MREADHSLPESAKIRMSGVASIPTYMNTECREKNLAITFAVGAVISRS